MLNTQARCRHIWLIIFPLKTIGMNIHSALVTKIIIAFHTDDTFGLTNRQHDTQKGNTIAVSTTTTTTIEVRFLYSVDVVFCLLIELT